MMAKEAGGESGGRRGGREHRGGLGRGRQHGGRLEVALALVLDQEAREIAVLRGRGEEEEGMRGEEERRRGE